MSDWIAIDEILAYVIPGATWQERNEIAMKRANTAGLPETLYLDACNRAGIEVRWDRPELAVVDGRAYVPRWAAPFLEATIARSAQQTRVLKRANADPEWRAAGLSAWRLGGLGGLALWIDEAPR